MEEKIAMAKELTQARYIAENKEALSKTFEKYKDKMAPYVFMNEYDVKNREIYNEKYAFPETHYIWYQPLDAFSKVEEDKTTSVYVIAKVSYYRSDKEEEPQDVEKIITKYIFDKSGILVNVKKY